MQATTHLRSTRSKITPEEAFGRALHIVEDYDPSRPVFDQASVTIQFFDVESLDALIDAASALRMEWSISRLGDAMRECDYHASEGADQ